MHGIDKRVLQVYNMDWADDYQGSHACFGTEENQFNESSFIPSAKTKFISILILLVLEFIRGGCQFCLVPKLIYHYPNWEAWSVE
jgi:hypothetical protein